jgi:heme-degrading monooxygenase HmoA
MYARMTRYEGGSPEAMDEALQTKKKVLPTEPGQTEGMTGAIFLVDRDNGTITTISLWESEDAMNAGEEIATRLREEATGEGETSSVEHYEVALFGVAQA